MQGIQCNGLTDPAEFFSNIQLIKVALADCPFTKMAPPSFKIMKNVPYPGAGYRAQNQRIFFVRICKH